MRVGVVAVFVVGLLSLVLDPYRNLQLASVAYLTCATAGLTVLTGLSGQISLGQGAFMAVGAYTAALLLPGWPLLLVLAASVGVAAAAGLVVGAAAARLRGPYLAGATMAFAVGLPALASYRGLSERLGGENGLVVLSPEPPGGVPFDRWQLLVCVSCAALVLVVLGTLAGGRVGRSWRALRDDEVAAELAGLPVARLQVLAFVISAACAGLAGGLLAFVDGLAAPGAFTLTLSLMLLSAVVLGGLGSLGGAVAGAALLVYLPAFATWAASGAHLPGGVAANLPLAVHGLVLVVVVIALPGGLAGAARRFIHVPAQRRAQEGSKDDATGTKASPAGGSAGAGRGSGRGTGAGRLRRIESGDGRR